MECAEGMIIPFDNLSIHTVREAAHFTIYYGQVIHNYDYCFDDYPACIQSPYQAYWHNDSLQDCIEICVESHPLCQAVSCNPS
jgi:hypothetical protein